MKLKSLFYMGTFVCTALAVLFGGTTVVGAVGPATDNATVLDIPADDQPWGEIKPFVAYVRQGPSLQSREAPPDFIPSFVGGSEGDGFKVTGNEIWYLDVDINAPGWLYIYEYFPEGEELPGRWLAYKWHLIESGRWRLGPFTPGDDEPEGQHIYRLWFYSDGQWAGEEDQNSPHGKLIYWTYVKGQEAQGAGGPAASQLPAVMPAKDKLLEKLRWLINSPIVIISLALLLFLLLGLYVSRRYMGWGKGRDAVSPSAEVESQRTPVLSPLTAVTAKILLPNGMELVLDKENRVIGRSDLARVLGIDELGLVSRRHFEIRVQDGYFCIEDLGSANGTKLNGADISGKGPVSLGHDDLIEVAGIITLKFYIL